MPVQVMKPRLESAALTPEDSAIWALWLWREPWLYLQLYKAALPSDRRDADLMLKAQQVAGSAVLRDLAAGDDIFLVLVRNLQGPDQDMTDWSLFA